jgi:hypothetical protein
MKEDTEFQEFKQKLPYKVPDSFFEQVSENTLSKAKQREEQKRKKSLWLWRSVSVAASLIGLALFGYFMLEPGKPAKNLIVQVEQTDSVQTNQQITDFAKSPAVAEIKKIVSEKRIEKETDMEGISDVLADLSDDELLQLDALFKTDPFMGESPQ